VEFREKLRGYHPDDVDAFVERVAAAFEELQQRLDQAQSRSSDPEVSEESIRRTLVMAQRTADMVVAEAQEVASKTLADARAETDLLLTDAREEAARLARQGRQSLQADVERLESDRDELERHIEALMDYAERQRTRLRDLLVEQLQSLDLHDTPVDALPVSEYVSASDDEPVAASDEEPDDSAEDVSEAVDALDGEWPEDDSTAPVDDPSPTGVLPAEDVDVFKRGRRVGSLVPAAGEDDPFLAELRRAVDPPDLAGAPEAGRGKVRAGSDERGGSRLFRRR
jgi:DivIVA domain-containing protein